MQGFGVVSRNAELFAEAKQIGGLQLKQGRRLGFVASGLADGMA